MAMPTPPQALLTDLYLLQTRNAQKTPYSYYVCETFKMRIDTMPLQFRDGIQIYPHVLSLIED